MRPTASELEILGVLWEQGPSTVRQVHEVLDGRKPTGYTTVLKLLQIMSEKGLVAREESARAHVYRAAAAREETQGQLVGDLVDRAFGGSAAELVMRALSTRPASQEELDEIRRMLDSYRGGAV
ncbi:BlaI/MecI/CopY family transcriptional regulator [Paludibaculum fermentans]|uniref:BlaI/MecI/CopY family transcriptional regulator n=1 Tax=Paludibaculum fermentans TaxID=1473598 RepID=A0A7S7NSK1_PALFE|nr:BlaI/MecI/CopY family transcriptional regulator [Paludibaculum fermentans]QOY88950.1 BlaI/MecI/CopY family transcriptional regulator [Paludibaculum fermentans]